jgi:hypothetical protein
MQTLNLNDFVTTGCALNRDWEKCKTKFIIDQADLSGITYTEISLNQMKL